MYISCPECETPLPPAGLVDLGDGGEGVLYACEVCTTSEDFFGEPVDVPLSVIMTPDGILLESL